MDTNSYKKIAEKILPMRVETTYYKTIEKPSTSVDKISILADYNILKHNAIINGK